MTRLSFDITTLLQRPFRNDGKYVKTENKQRKVLTLKLVERLLLRCSYFTYHLKHDQKGKHDVEQY